MLKIASRMVVEALTWLLHPAIGMTAGGLWLALQLEKHTGEPWLMRTMTALLGFALLHLAVSVTYERLDPDEDDTEPAGDLEVPEDDGTEVARPLARGRGELEDGG